MDIDKIIIINIAFFIVDVKTHHHHHPLWQTFWLSNIWQIDEFWIDQLLFFSSQIKTVFCAIWKKKNSFSSPASSFFSKDHQIQFNKVCMCVCWSLIGENWIFPCLIFLKSITILSISFHYRYRSIIIYQLPFKLSFIHIWINYQIEIEIEISNRNSFHFICVYACVSI